MYSGEAALSLNLYRSAQAHVLCRPMMASFRCMTPIDHILALVDNAFGGCARPEHFTNYKHCSECAEHDELLRSRDRETLSLDDVGSPGWDCITFCSSVGVAYYMPRLARLALDIDSGGQLWYAQQLMFQFWSAGPYNEHYEVFTPCQRHAIAAIAAHLIEQYPTDVSHYADELFQIHGIWST